MTFLHPALKRLAPYFIFFIALEACVRIALLSYSGTDIAGAGILSLVRAFFIGFAFDLAVFCYMAIPVMAYSLALPENFQGGKLDRILSSVIFFIFTYVLIFSAIGEWLFWDEFETRYNFIAVDYLVYTHEVIGNITESYPVFPLLGGMALIALLLAFFYYKKISVSLPRSVPLPARALSFAAIVLLSIASFFAFSTEYAEASDNRYVNELSRNGIFELFSAFRNNELDYDHFYKTRPIEEVADFVRKDVGGNKSSDSPLERRIENKGGKQYNLVLITVESLSAKFLKKFGETRNITPHLDALIPHSLFFTNLYATGTRTVYGLSSITLSIPPIPGNSIVRRPSNENLFSLGHVLKSKGYDTNFIYGGYGYFDNMNKFFAGNGYDIIDRASFAKDEVNFANIWGIADDDVYRKAMKENDAAHARGQPFFDMIMTTSNHRPYTFPAGKIDLPSKTSGRKGGVKFTDFAIGEFLKEAEKRPWFKNTIFVIVADHTAGGSGKTQLDPDKYRIPMWVYAPGIIQPREINDLMSQIDVAPTILGLMGMNYDSRFYGKDIMKEKPERAFISNYQSLGYLTKEGLMILSPVNEAEFLKREADGSYVTRPEVPEQMLQDTIGFYQGAAQWREWSKQPAIHP